jgi:integration host factor subunit beta
MTRSELIAVLLKRQPHLEPADVDMAARHLLRQLGDALARGERIEIRGFGSFALRYRQSRIGRNPNTGEAVALPARYLPHFRPGRELRDRVGRQRFLCEEGRTLGAGIDSELFKMYQYQETCRK